MSDTANDLERLEGLYEAQRKASEDWGASKISLGDFRRSVGNFQAAAQAAFPALVKEIREGRADREFFIDEANRKLPVVCGQGAAGCGKILTRMSVYRCVDCSIPYCRECLRKHFEGESSDIDKLRSLLDRNEAALVEARAERDEYLDQFWELVKAIDPDAVFSDQESPDCIVSEIEDIPAEQREEIGSLQAQITELETNANFALAHEAERQAEIQRLSDEYRETLALRDRELARLYPEVQRLREILRDAPHAEMCNSSHAFCVNCGEIRYGHWTGGECDTDTVEPQYFTAHSKRPCNCWKSVIDAATSAQKDLQVVSDSPSVDAVGDPRFNSETGRGGPVPANAASANSVLHSLVDEVTRWLGMANHSLCDLMGEANVAVMRTKLAAATSAMEPTPLKSTDDLCTDCPPFGYPNDRARCAECPWRKISGEMEKPAEGPSEADKFRAHMKPCEPDPDCDYVFGSPPVGASTNGKEKA